MCALLQLEVWSVCLARNLLLSLKWSLDPELGHSWAIAWWGKFCVRNCPSCMSSLLHFPARYSSTWRRRGRECRRFDTCCVAEAGRGGVVQIIDRLAGERGANRLTGVPCLLPALLPSLPSSSWFSRSCVPLATMSAAVQCVPSRSLLATITSIRPVAQPGLVFHIQWTLRWRFCGDTTFSVRHSEVLSLSPRPCVLLMIPAGLFEAGWYKQYYANT